MNLKRRRLALSLSLLTLTSAAACSSLFFLQDKEKNPTSGMEVSSVTGMELTNRRTIKNANGSVSTIVNYTITPEDTSYTLISFMDWSTEKNPEFESSTWGKGIDPQNYVSCVVNQDKKEINFTCKEAFGRTILCTMMAKENPNVTAEIKLDYVRKELDKGTADFNHHAFVDNEPISVVTTLPNYTIGSKTPEAPKWQIQSVKFDTGPNNTPFETLMPCPDISSFSNSSTVEYFNGETYETLAPMSCYSRMCVNAKKYFLDVLSSNGEKVFSKEELYETMTFRKKPNENVDYVYITSCANGFIQNYKEALKKGMGFYAEIKYNGVITSEVKFDIDLETSTITDLGLGKSAIEF